VTNIDFVAANVRQNSVLHAGTISALISTLIPNREIPYHLGFTCEQYQTYKSAKHCRFCNSQIKKDNMSKDKHKALENVCISSECVEKKDISCEKMLLCGHPCGGIRGNG
jgi:hypothetical protein